MQRAIFEDILSPAECRELTFILKSCGVIGYRPHVVSCTPQDLIASNSAQLVLPLLNAAARVQQLVEGRFGKECELFTEFVGLISWKAGASIGWHHDSNREYLRQRHYSAVCYLNDQGTDFAGGTFRFRDGQPKSVAPVAGRVIAYSSGEESTHSVDPVTRGERTTLALWFTTDPDHSKDGILLPQLQSALQRALSRVPGGSFQTVIPYPNDPPDTFFVEPEAWSRESLGPNVGSGKDSAERVGTDPDLENGTDAVSRQETTEQPAALEEIGAAASSTNKADRQEAKRARYADTADTFLGNAFEEVSKAEESGGAILSFAAGKGDLRCERLKELGLRFVSESGNTGRDEESPEVVLPEVVSEVVPDVVPEAVQSGEWRPVEDGAILAGQALVSAGVSGDVRNVPGSETAESHMVADKSGRSGNQTPEGELESQGEDLGADGMVPLQWLGGEAFGAEFRSRLHALQVLYHFVECVEAPLPSDGPPHVSTAPLARTSALTSNTTIAENRSRKNALSTRRSASLLRAQGLEALQMWEIYSRLRWQHLQGVLQQWSILGCFTDDAFDSVVQQHLCRSV